jgi:peptidoglycan/xylan/chitin deacetylase (PgdA/CDA1 family)
MFTEYYSEVQKLKPASARSHIRKVALDVLSLPLLLDQSYLKKPRLQFLYVHHVFKDEERALVALIEFLQKDHFFISYSEAVDRLLAGDIDKPYIVFSSDDGLKNNLTAAAIFKRYNISACFFVNPYTIEQHDFNLVRDFCYEKIHFPPVEFLTWQDLDLLKKMGQEIGSHTISHVNIAACDEQTIHEEIVSSFNLLNERLGDIKHFAYPYGRYFHFNETGRRLVFDAGFQSCASAERGCHITDRKRLKKEEVLLRRDHVLLHWNLNHLKYFLINNSKKASVEHNFFPKP